MRRSVVSAVVLGLTLLSAGCSLPAEVDLPKRVKDSVAEEPPVAGVQDLTGTTWTINYIDPALGTESNYDITFRAGGEMLDGDADNTTLDNDRWEQDGTTVIFYFNDAYAVYTGELSAPGSLTGTATNVVGANWSWSAVLKG